MWSRTVTRASTLRGAGHGLTSFEACCAAPTPLTDRDHDEPQTCRSHAHLHFHVPAKRRAVEAGRRSAPKRTDWRHASETRAVDKADQQTGQTSRYDMSNRQTSPIALPRRREPIAKSAVSSRTGASTVGTRQVRSRLSPSKSSTTRISKLGVQSS